MTDILAAACKVKTVLHMEWLLWVFSVIELGIWQTEWIRDVI